MHHELLLLVLAVTGAFSRCSQATDPIDVHGESDESTTTTVEDGGAGGEDPAGTTSTTGTTTGPGGEGGEGGTGGTGGVGGEGGAGGSGGEAGAGGEGGSAPLGALGFACDAGSECASGTCLDLDPSGQIGVCTTPCGEDDACGEDEVCLPAQIDGLTYCWRKCGTTLPCEAGPDCYDDPAGMNGGYFCVPT